METDVVFAKNQLIACRPTVLPRRRAPELFPDLDGQSQNIHGTHNPCHCKWLSSTTNTFHNSDYDFTAIY